MRRSRTPLPGRVASVGLAWTSTMPRASAIRRSSGSKGHRGSPRGGRWRGPRRVEHPREPERRMRLHARAVRPSPTRCPPTSARRRSPWVHRAPAEPSASKLRRSSRPCRVVAVVERRASGYPFSGRVSSSEMSFGCPRHHRARRRPLGKAAEWGGYAVCTHEYTRAHDTFPGVWGRSR